MTPLLYKLGEWLTLSLHLDSDQNRLGFYIAAMSKHHKTCDKDETKSRMDVSLSFPALKTQMSLVLT